MNARSRMGSVLMSMLLLMPAARAEPATGVQIEVYFLLGYIEGSGCEFYRNGTWYNSQAAQAHLRDKYKYLVAQDLINSTEQFIDKAATQSSLTGQKYAVRCNGGAAITSNQWLRDRLAHFRAG